MPPCENNPKCTNRTCPVLNRKVKLGANPDSIISMRPSWSFYKCDKEGRWAFTNEALGEDFWSTIMPRLKSFEQLSWGDLEGKENHFVKVDTLNKCARDRLDELLIVEEQLFSLKIANTLRVYGIRQKSTLFVLWYDNDHGDNDTCVCRSYKKHTH